MISARSSWRAVCAILGGFVAGCGYPDFDFQPVDSGNADSVPADVASGTDALPDAPPADLSVFYVSKSGNDAWSGHFADPRGGGDGPFLTVERGVRALDEHGATATTKGATLLIRKGTYFIDHPLVVTAQASGSATRPTLIQSYLGESAILSAGVRLTSWKTKAGSSDPNLLEAPSGFTPPELAGVFPTLRIETAGKSQWAIESRWPKKSNEITNPDWQNDAFWMYAGGTPVGGVFSSATNFLRIPLATGDADALSKWDLSSARVQFFPLTYTVYNLPLWTMATGATPAIQLLTGPWGATDQLPIGMRFAVSNIAGAIANPNEWAIDRKSGVVTFQNPAGEDITTKSLVLSRLTNLLAIRGSATTPVENIAVEGLTFADTAFGQNDFFPANTLDFGVDVSFANHIALRRNFFEHLGGSALAIRKASKDVVVEQNVFAHVGQAAIEVLSSTETVGPDASLAPSQTKIVGNYLFDVTHFGKLGAIYVFAGTDGLVEGNLIHMSAGSGIQILGLSSSVSSRYKILFNDVHTVNYGIADGGGIYLTGNDSSLHHHEIRGNRILDIQGAQSDGGHLLSPGGGVGIYLDNGEAGDDVQANIVSGTSDSGLFIHEGAHDNVTTNLFIDGGTYAMAIGGPGVSDNLVSGNVIGVTSANFFATSAIWRVSLDRGVTYASAMACDGNYYTVPDPAGVKTSNTGAIVFYRDLSGTSTQSSMTSWNGLAIDTTSTLAGPSGEFVRDPAGHVVDLSAGTISARAHGPAPNLVTGLSHYANSAVISKAKKDCLTGLTGLSIYSFPAMNMPDPESVLACFRKE